MATTPTTQSVPSLSRVSSTPATLTVQRFFRLLADETRLVMLQLLAISDLRAGEISEALQLSANAVSYHLKQFRNLQLLQDHRSSADARDVYYHLDIARLQTDYSLAGDALYPGLFTMAYLSDEHARNAQTVPSEDALLRPLRVLFLCTNNSARSQLAEGILRRMGGEQVEVYSAGSEPTSLDPDALVVMRELGIDPTPHAAKSLTTFLGQQFDYIITVCDRAAEECPVFPGAGQQLRWGFADPSVAQGTEEERLQAFRHTRDLILVRLQQWLSEQGAPPANQEVAAALPRFASPTPALPGATAQTTRLPSFAPPTRVLILCTGNSARSQMAEAWLRYMGGSAYEVCSAGTHPTVVNPLAIQVMAERNIDISQARSKSVTVFLDHPFDYVITVCDQAAEQCPIFPGKGERLHWSFPDPAAVTGSDAERLQAFRDVRDGLYFQFWQWISQQLPLEDESQRPA